MQVGGRHVNEPKRGSAPAATGADANIRPPTTQHNRIRSSASYSVSQRLAGRWFLNQERKFRSERDFERRLAALESKVVEQDRFRSGEQIR